MSPRQVSEIMSPDPVVISPGTTIGRALQVAYVSEVRHLLVAELGLLTGVTCICELWDEPRHLHIASRIRRQPITIAPSLPVPLARSLMIRHEIDCLPVLRDGMLLGVVTRRDLREIGLTLAEDACVHCGDTRHVRRTPDCPLPACHDCRAALSGRAVSPIQ
jgi:CBS domain-containing protein